MWIDRINDVSAHKRDDELHIIISHTTDKMGNSVVDQLTGLTFPSESRV